MFRRGNERTEERLDGRSHGSKGLEVTVEAWRGRAGDPESEQQDGGQRGVPGSGRDTHKRSALVRSKKNESLSGGERKAAGY